ncbi:unnamed protein product [Parnassius apollo]|uniref:(apollo) hypothetical protein n=1 Tax=Parnassius apollo TaxID=110799 RepID=A0A8S3XQQ6_PARAO|nr:unnamed protein product [Parnassius apollo]
MASKVLVPTAPFAKLQVKKSPPDTTSSGFIISGNDAVARVAHLEHSVRFLQEQHRLMLSGLHAEIEALRERNRDLQFQLIFNKESAPKASTSAGEDVPENSEEAQLRREVGRLEREAAAARGEARAAEARALQLQRLLDAQAEKLRALESRAVESEASGAGAAAGAESRGELRARLADAERLVRRLRGDAERQRREVLAAAGRGAADAGGAVTNLLFDGAAARHAHLQCMKNSLHASLRASGLDSYGYQNTYHFPPVQDFWGEHIRDEVTRGARRRPLALPELTPHRATVYANTHARGRGYGYEKSKKPPVTNGDTAGTKTQEEPQDEPRLKELSTDNLSKTNDKSRVDSMITYPELKIVVTKIIPHGKVCTGAAVGAVGAGAAGGVGGESRRSRRTHHRKHSTADHT